MTADINALLGAGSEFEGKLTFEGTVRIDGRFTGEIFSDGTLVVGEGARIEAEIRVGTVMVYGEVIGDIFANNGVELHAPASLRGNITSPALHIDKGVFFDGNCQMSSGADPQPQVEQPQRLPPAHRVTAPRPAAEPMQERMAQPSLRGKISGLYQSENSYPNEPRGVDFKHDF